MPDENGKLTPKELSLIESHIGLANSLALKRYKTATHALELDELKAIAYWGLV